MRGAASHAALAFLNAVAIVAGQKTLATSVAATEGQLGERGVRAHEANATLKDAKHGTRVGRSRVRGWRWSIVGTGTFWVQQKRADRRTQNPVDATHPSL